MAVPYNAQETCRDPLQNTRPIGHVGHLNGALLKALQAPAPDQAVQQDIEQLPQRILAQAFEQVAT